MKYIVWYVDVITLSPFLAFINSRCRLIIYHLGDLIIEGPVIRLRIASSCDSHEHGNERLHLKVWEFLDHLT
jgi:hypothetical protein